MKRRQIFQSRGALILSLVPKTGTDSDAEEDGHEDEGLEALPEEIEANIERLFEVYEEAQNDLAETQVHSIALCIYYVLWFVS